MQDRPVRQNGRTGRVPRESSRAARDSTALHTWRDLGLELACVITQSAFDDELIKFYFDLVRNPHVLTESYEV